MLRRVLRIRRAVAADLPGIFAIHDDEISNGTATLDELPFDELQRQAWLAAHATERYPALVADDGEHILAWGALSPWSTETGYVRTAMVSVFVHKNCGREGLGRSILHELITHARAVELGVLLSAITAESQNNLELHAEFGFRQVGTLRRIAKKFGRLLDVELFELELDER